MTRSVFLVGDFNSNTGPAIANKALKKALGERASYSKRNTRIGRLFELFFKTISSDVICFCGFSEMNVCGIKMARLFKKKSMYLMHGYVELEAELNHIVLSAERRRAEQFILRNADMVLCVSRLLANKVLENHSRKKNVRVVYDIVEPICWDDAPKRKSLQIMSTGGGVRQKNNLAVCKAIEMVNATLDTDKQLTYVIIGKPCDMRKEFEKYSFVRFLGEVSKQDCLRLMQESKVYIQNSFFETFGMSIVEAVSCGCEVVISRSVGALEVINGLDDGRIIEDVNDVREISKKIYNVMFHNNKKKAEVNWRALSGRTISTRFEELLEVV